MTFKKRMTMMMMMMAMMMTTMMMEPLRKQKLPLVGARFSWFRGPSVLPARGTDV